MKNLIFYSLMVCFFTSIQAQEITELEEARVFSNPSTEKLSSDVDEFSFSVKEEYTGEFMQNPLGFMKQNFDIQNLIEHIDGNYDTYQISFRTNKGALEAEFNKKGELGRHNQSFKDVTLSRKIMADLYRDHKGWAAVENKYIARGSGDQINKAFYKIKLVKGNKSQNIRLDQEALDGRLAKD